MVFQCEKHAHLYRKLTTSILEAVSRSGEGQALRWVHSWVRV